MENYTCPLCLLNQTKFFLTDFKNHKYWKCNDCNFVFRDANIAIENKNLDDWADTIDPDGNRKDLTQMKEFKIKNWYGEIINYIENIPTGKIIDIGCGLGFLLSAIPNSWEKHGFDISQFAITHVKKNFSEVIMHEDLHLDVSPPPENQRDRYDVVTCYHVIEHIKNPDIFFKHLSMLLKPQGLLIIGTPNIGSLASKIFKGNFRLLGDEGHCGIFDSKNLETLFKKHNFEVVKKEYPFLKTEYCSLKNILKMLIPNRISPAFYGNIMTFYGKKLN